MTRPQRDGKPVDEFRDWLRKHPRLDSVRNGWVQTDCDLLIHQYRPHVDRIGDRTVQHMMWLEYKQFGADISPSQRDTLAMIGQAIRQKSRRVISPILGKKVTLCIWGVHLLRMSGATPSESEWLIWNKTKINLDTLERLLRFQIDPFKFKPIKQRRHHKIGSDGY